MKAAYSIVHLVDLVRFNSVIVQSAYFIEHLLYVCYALPKILVSLVEDVPHHSCVSSRFGH